MKIKNFKDLEIWKRSVKLTEGLYKITDSFPKEEMYGLSSQIKRAGVSIPSNISKVLLACIIKNIDNFCAFHLVVVQS
jgi:four helix bundle protein